MGFFDFFRRKKTNSQAPAQPTPAPAPAPAKPKPEPPKTATNGTSVTGIRYTKVEIQYTGDGLNTSQNINTRQNVIKKKLLPLNKKAQDYGYTHGWNSLNISYSCDHIIIKIEGTSTKLQDNDINEGSNEYICSIVSYTWCR